MNYSVSSPEQAIDGGFLVFGICAYYGLRFLIRGIRNDILDDYGNPLAGRSWFIAGGIFMILPLIGFLLFVLRQRYLAHTA